MNKMMKRILSFLLVFLMMATLLPANAVFAKKAPKLSASKVTLSVGKSKKITIKNAKKPKKLKFTLNAKGKKLVSIKKLSSSSLRITAKRVGKTTAKVSFVVGKKKITKKLSLSIQKKKVAASPTTNVTDAPTPSTAPSTPTPTITPIPSVIPTQTPTPSPSSTALKDLYSDSFLVGAAINGNTREVAAINHEGMASILKEQFNSTTLSNLMKPVFLLDEDATKALADSNENTTSVVTHFDSCDPSLTFCQENNIKMRGHVLVWHTQTPDWFFRKGYNSDNDYVSKAVMAGRMENYIKQVVEHCQTKYPGVVYCWDVVNECVSDGPSEDNSDGWYIRTNGNPWYTTMGTDYVYKAFEYARKYVKDGARLIYNDYNVFQPSKRTNIYTIVNKLKAKGLIDGIGLQPTVLLNYPSELKGNKNDSFETCLRTYAELGLEIQITELSFQLDEADAENPSAELLTRQADRYQEMYELLLAMDTDNGGPCNITSVSVFGICDDYPLYDNCIQNLYLYTKDCTPKEAFTRIQNVGIQHSMSK